MRWLPWVLLAPIQSLAATLIKPWRQLQPHFEGIGRHERMVSSDVFSSAPELAVARLSACSEKPLVEKVSTDGLTGLTTLCSFIEALDEEWRRSTRTGRRFSLAMVDLDGFRQVNERLGELAGDKVLKTAAALLEAGAEQPDGVARLGGDEFGILLPETNLQQAAILSEKLRAAVEADEFLAAHMVTASFGVATFPDHARSLEELLRIAAYGVDLARQCQGNCVKMPSPATKSSDAELDRRLLEAFLEAPGGISSATLDSFCPDPNKLEQMRPMWDAITALAFALEAKDPYRQGHCEMVSRLAAQIALQLKLPQEEVEEIRLAGLVHDIGKVRVPESVYNKPDLLTGTEYETMRTHPVSGAEMLEPLNLKRIEQIVRHHHERYDGKGYPGGLAAERIPRGARIVAVAEGFHSMISDLPYKSACTFEDALDELRLCSGTQFDPEVVSAFLEWAKIYNDSRKQPQQGKAPSGVCFVSGSHENLSTKKLQTLVPPKRQRGFEAGITSTRPGIHDEVSGLQTSEARNYNELGSYRARLVPSRVFDHRLSRIERLVLDAYMDMTTIEYVREEDGKRLGLVNGPYAGTEDGRAPATSAKTVVEYWQLRGATIRVKSVQAANRRLLELGHIVRRQTGSGWIIGIPHSIRWWDDKTRKHISYQSSCWNDLFQQMDKNDSEEQKTTPADRVSEAA